MTTPYAAEWLGARRAVVAGLAGGITLALADLSWHVLAAGGWTLSDHTPSSLSE